MKQNCAFQHHDGCAKVVAVDYRKLDAALAGELGQVSPASNLQVFIHTAEALTEAQTTELAALGVPVASAEPRILTATVSPDAVEKLSELPWVKRIALARKLRPLG